MQARRGWNHGNRTVPLLPGTGLQHFREFGGQGCGLSRGAVHARMNDFPVCRCFTLHHKLERNGIGTAFNLGESKLNGGRFAYRAL